MTVQAPDKYGATGEVSVTIKDSREHEATGRVIVSTATNNGPVINSLNAMPQQG